MTLCRGIEESELDGFCQSNQMYYVKDILGPLGHTTGAVYTLSTSPSAAAAGAPPFTYSDSVYPESDESDSIRLTFCYNHDTPLLCEVRYSPGVLLYPPFRSEDAYITKVYYVPCIPVVDNWCLHNYGFVGFYGFDETADTTYGDTHGNVIAFDRYGTPSWTSEHQYPCAQYALNDLIRTIRQTYPDFCAPTPPPYGKLPESD